MRTFLSHDDTARCSLTGEKARSEIPSSGGDVRATSLERSPVVLGWVEPPALPKSVDIRTRSSDVNVPRRKVRNLESTRPGAFYIGTSKSWQKQRVDRFSSVQARPIWLSDWLDMLTAYGICHCLKWSTISPANIHVIQAMLNGLWSCRSFSSITISYTEYCAYLTNCLCSLLVSRTHYSHSRLHLAGLPSLLDYSSTPYSK